MPQGRLPRRPLAMRLLLWRRLRQKNESEPSAAATARTSTNAMSLEALRRWVRIRVRAFLRNTRLVGILGAIVLAGMIWAALHLTLAPTQMRVAAGPPASAEVKLVEMLSHKFATEHAKVQFHLVATDGPKASAAALAGGEVDLAVLPSTLRDAIDWPVIAILRKNVMALVVPTSPPPGKKQTIPPSAVKETGAAEGKDTSAEPEKTGSKSKEAKAGTASEGVGSDSGANAEKGDKAATSDKADRSEKATNVTGTKTDKTGDEAAAKSTAAKNVAKSANKSADATTADTAVKTATANAADKAATDETAAKATNKSADNSDDADKDDKASSSGADADKLDSVAKLAGHRIGVVTGNAATPQGLGVVLSHYGVSLDQVQISLIDPTRVAEVVKAREVDVLFVAGAETGQAINDVVAAATVNGKAPSFIPIDQAEGMAKRNPAFQSVDIEAGTFGGHPPSPAESFKSLSFPEYLVAKRSFHHDAVGTLSKLIFTSRLALAAAMPGEIKIQAPATDKDANVVVHPGALAYLTDDQKSFFDRYGDDIFYGLLIFPIFGSAIAAVAGYFRRGSRTRRLRLLRRLLDLTQKANHAPSLEALDKLQVDVDDLVVAIIHQTEQEEYDQGMQISFGLALDQVRFAISSRRAVLLQHGGAEAKPGAQAAAA
jgi:TRAP-type uncharacterized transport system substrate-binding protein